jgi:hypothetical protein
MAGRKAYQHHRHHLALVVKRRVASAGVTTDGFMFGQSFTDGAIRAVMDMKITATIGFNDERSSKFTKLPACGRMVWW